MRKDYLNLRVTYSILSLWKSTPEERKIKYLISQWPTGLAIIAATITAAATAWMNEGISLLTIITFFISLGVFRWGLNITENEDLLPVFTETKIFPDSLTRSKYITAEWKDDTIYLYMEDKQGNRAEMLIEEFFSLFQGRYKLFFREEGIMGKAEVQIEPSQVNDLKPQLTPLQIDMEIQQDGTVAIFLDHREERWYDNKQLEN